MDRFISKYFKVLPKKSEILSQLSKLKIGNKVYVSQLPSEDYKFLHSDNTVVCQIKQSRVSVDIEDDEDEEGTEGAEGAEGTAEGAAPAEA